LITNIKSPLHLSLLLIAVGPILIDVSLRIFWPDIYWENKRLHSAGETAGAIIAIFMALLLLLKHREKPEENSYFLAIGFLSMGLLDGFHAISKPGDSFVFLHSIASLIGSFWFVQFWFPGPIKRLFKKNLTLWITISGSLLLGSWCFILPETLPAMTTDGEFTTTAIAINVLAGMIFLVATYYFFLEFTHSKTIENYLFSCMFLLFSIAEISFFKSSLWDGGWWFWHLLRLVAYILVLLVIIWQYIKIANIQKENEKKWKSLTINSPDHIMLLNLDYTIQFINYPVPDLTIDQVLGKSVLDFVPSDYHRIATDCFEHIIQSGEPDHYETKYVSDDGESHSFFVRISPRFGENKKIKGFISTSTNTTEQKRAEDALKYSEEKYRLAMDATTDGLWDWNVSTGEVYYSPSWSKILDEKNVLPNYESWSNRIHSKDKESVQSTVQEHLEGRTIYWEKEHRLYTKTGIWKWVLGRGRVVEKSEDGQPIRMVGTMTDISDRKKLEKNLQQTQRMETIGTLAGGIAHDFNNILFPIIGHAEMLSEDIPSDSSLMDSTNEILVSALRAKDLVNQILTFSRQEKGELQLMKMQPIIKEALKLIRSTIPTTINVNQYIQSDCGVIKADPTQIHQIVMNIATNAYHAMEDTGGELTIKLKEIEIGRSQLINSEMIPGLFACLTIADKGIGMNKDLKNKIFDPFFTTKEKGKGTGMGLSVVHGIVTSMHGGIQIFSEPGEGTEFRIYFPIEKGNTGQKEKINQPLQGGTEHILLVDDEEGIINMESKMLERMGYQVTPYSSSVEALEAFRRNYDNFDVVISDLAMPNMAGEKLASEMLKIRPNIPIILNTGFSDKLNPEIAKMIGIKGILMKPIVKSELAQTLRKVLDT